MKEQQNAPHESWHRRAHFEWKCTCKIYLYFEAKEESKSKWVSLTFRANKGNFKKIWRDFGRWTTKPHARNPDKVTIKKL